MSSREGRCPFRMRRGIRYVKMRLGKGKYSVNQWVAESDVKENTLLVTVSPNVTVIKSEG